MEAGGAELDELYKYLPGISGATAGVDTTFETGLNLMEDFDRKRAILFSIFERMETMSERLAAVNGIMGQI